MKMKVNYHQLMTHVGFQEKTELLGLLRMGLQEINQMTPDDVIFPQYCLQCNAISLEIFAATFYTVCIV